LPKGKNHCEGRITTQERRLFVLDINRSGCADGVQRFPQIWQKVVHMGGGAIILNECVFTLGDKVISEL
jgi:hypothetical protein